MEYGLIGFPLKHSFSKEIHSQIGKLVNNLYDYQLLELNENELSSFLKKKNFKAINVTIPYKQKVIPYLDEISEEASLINAVNLIVNRNGKLYGYNTDYFGLKMLVEKVDIKSAKRALILGTGATSKTATSVLKDLGIKEILYASRTKKEGCITYDELSSISDEIDLIINTTPCGMFPNNSGKIIDIKDFKNLKGYIDVVYNPIRTLTVQDAMNKNIYTVGGLEMLVGQAIYAYEIFSQNKVDLNLVEKIYKIIEKEKTNVVLIGMPSCGKTTIGKLLSIKMKRKFIDIDEEIEKEENMDIPSIFRTKGENYFRDLESKVIEDVSKLSGVIISTGGGSVLRRKNIDLLKQNGKVYFIDRSLENLTATSSRPLSSNLETLRKRYEERYHIYMESKDEYVDGDKTPEDICDIIEVKL